MNNTPISKCERKNPMVYSIESTSDLKKFANAFVYVTSIDTTFYVDCNHEITILSSGIVLVDKYDIETNPQGLRNQFAYDKSNNSVIYFTATGDGVLVNSATTATEFASLLNRPKYGGVEMTGDTNIPTVPTNLDQLDGADRVSALEESVAKLENEPQIPDVSVLTDAIVTITPSGVTIAHTSQNLASGATSSEAVELPTATNIQAGLMTPETYTNLSNLQQTVAELSTDSEGNTSSISGLQTQINTINTALGNKQDTLVSGDNVKTINGQSIIGAGDIVIPTGSSTDPPLTDQGALRANGLPQSIIRDPAFQARQTDIMLNYDLVDLTTGQSEPFAIQLNAPTDTVSGIVTASMYQNMAFKKIITASTTWTNIANNTSPPPLTATIPNLEDSYLWLVIGEFRADDNSTTVYDTDKIVELSIKADKLVEAGVIEDGVAFGFARGVSLNTSVRAKVMGSVVGTYLSQPTHSPMVSFRAMNRVGSTIPNATATLTLIGIKQ